MRRSRLATILAGALLAAIPGPGDLDGRRAVASAAAAAELAALVTPTIRLGCELVDPVLRRRPAGDRLPLVGARGRRRRGLPAVADRRRSAAPADRRAGLRAGRSGSPTGTSPAGTPTRTAWSRVGRRRHAARGQQPGDASASAGRRRTLAVQLRVRDRRRHAAARAVAWGQSHRPAAVRYVLLPLRRRRRPRARSTGTGLDGPPRLPRHRRRGRPDHPLRRRRARRETGGSWGSAARTR